MKIRLLDVFPGTIFPFDFQLKTQVLLVLWRSSKTKNAMAWIKTIPFAEADEKLQKILLATRMNYPTEYEIPAPKASPVNESIVDSHTLIPDALFHAFSTFSALMSPDLPLSRRQHEMIATMVSVTNDCFY